MQPNDQRIFVTRFVAFGAEKGQRIVLNEKMLGVVLRARVMAVILGEVLLLGVEWLAGFAQWVDAIPHIGTFFGSKSEIEPRIATFTMKSSEVNLGDSDPWAAKVRER